MIVEFTEDYEYCVSVGKKPKTAIIMKGEQKEVKKFVGENLIRLDVAKKV